MRAALRGSAAHINGQKKPLAQSNVNSEKSSIESQAEHDSFGNVETPEVETSKKPEFGMSGSRSEGESHCDSATSFQNSKPKQSEVKPRTANPDAWGRLIGPHNIAPLVIDGIETMSLLDTGAQISTISKKWVEDLCLPIEEIDDFLEIEQAGGSCLDYEGVVEIHISSSNPPIDLAIPILVVPYIPYHDEVPITLGTHTLKSIFDLQSVKDCLPKEVSSELPTSWKYVQQCLDLQARLEQKPDCSLGVVKLSKAITIPAFSSKGVHCLSKVRNYGMQVNVMVEHSDKTKLPKGLNVQNTYTDIVPGSKKIPVAVRNTSARDILLPKGTIVGSVYSANKIPTIVAQSVKVSKLKADIEIPVNKPTTDQTKEFDDKWLLDEVDISGFNECSESVQKLAQKTILDYKCLFAKNDMDMGKTHLVKHDIQLTDYTPFKEGYRRIPPHLYEEVRTHLKEMLDLGVIRKSQSPWSSSIVLVRKKDGKLRFCIDLRKLNLRTVKDNYSLPKIEHHLDQLIGAEWFSTLDLKSGYWQVELTEESKPYTAFTCGPLGFYECELMPFGASNAPATFQRLMENCLGDLNLAWCVVYLDDIIIYGKTPEEHLERLAAVFEKLKQAGLKLKPSKCNFFRKEISFLGHIVSKEGIATDPSKIEAVDNWPRPRTVNDLRSFLGFVGYYRKFINSFSSIARPLNDLLVGLDNSIKSTKKQFLEWHPEQEEAFLSLKKACCTAPVLGYADYTKPFVLHTDSSLDGLGAILYQKDSKEKLRVIAYASRSLSKSEKNYPAHKLEFLAMKWAVTDKFKEYLYGPGSYFEVYTDNNPLTYVLSTAKLDATTQRWIAALANYDFSIFYKSGKHNTDADALSRIKWPTSVDDVVANRQACVKLPPKVIQAIFQGASIPFGLIEVVMNSARVIPSSYLDNQEENEFTDTWKKLQADDPKICQLIDLIQSKNLKKKEVVKDYPELKLYVKYLRQLYLKNGILYRKVFSQDTKKSPSFFQLVLPTQLIPKVLRGCHDEVGHVGRDKTLELVRERFFFPTMYAEVIKHLSSCRTCLVRKGVAPKAELCPITTTRPLELVHMDYLQLEPSKGNIENVLVITDHFTRYSQAYPTKSQTAQITAKVLWENFILHYGFPEKFLSDQGRNFESELISELCKLARVQKLRTTPYHPMTNGQCERFNRTLCGMLGTLREDEKLDWKSHISTMVHAYNCTRNASTNFSPYFLMFGRHPRLPIDLELGIHRVGHGVTFSRSKYIDRLQKRLNYAFGKAKLFSEKEQSRNKTRYDRKSKNLKLETGDLVLVRKTAFRGKHKIQNKWEDEDYVIMNQPNSDIPVFVVKPVIGGKERVLHRNLLLPLGYKEPVVSDSSDEEDIEISKPLSKIVQDSSQEKVEISPLEDTQIFDFEIDLPKESLELEEELVDNSDEGNLWVEPETEITLLDSRKEGENLSPRDVDSSVDISKLIEEADTNTKYSTDGELTRFLEQGDNRSSIGLEIKDPQINVNSSTDTNAEVSDSIGNLDEILVTPDEDSENQSKLKASIEVSQVLSDVEQENIPPRRSSRKNLGAPPTRFGQVFTHQMSTPNFEFQL